MVSLNSKKKKAILELLNCLIVGNTLESLAELKDGYHLLKLMQFIEFNNDPESLTPSGRFKLIADSLTEFFHISVESIISFQCCESGVEIELAKISVLIISALVQQSVHSSCHEVINAMIHLENSVQEEIKQCLEAVITDNDDSDVVLADRLSRVLSKKYKHITTPKKHSCIDITPVNKNRMSSLRSRLRYPSSTSSPSPLKTLLESPEMAQRLAKREHDREITNIRTLLSNEQNRVMELENEIYFLHQSLSNKDKDMAELRQRISDLRICRDTEELNMDYKVMSRNYEEEIQNLQMKITKLDDLRLIKEELQSENSNLLINQNELQEKLYLLDAKVSNAHIQAKKESEEEITELGKKCSNYKLEIMRLQGELQGVIREADAMRQLHEEKIAELIKLHHSPEMTPTGECLGTVVTDLRVHELETLLEELKLLLERQKTISDTLDKEKQEVQSKVVSLNERINYLEEQLTVINVEKEEAGKLLKCEIDNLQLEKGQLYEHLDNVRKVNLELQEKLSHLSCEKMKLVTDSQKEIANLHTTIVGKDKNLIECWEKEKRYQFEKNELDNRLKELSQQKIDIQTSLQNAEESAKLFEQERNNYVLQFQTLEKTYNDKCKLLSEKQLTCEKLNKEKETLIKQIDSLQKDTILLKEINDKDFSQKEKLKLKYKQQCEEIRIIQQRLDSESRESGILKEAVTSLEKNNTELTSKLTNLNEKICNLENNNSSLIKEKNDLSKQNQICLATSDQYKENFDRIQLEKCALIEEKKSLEINHENHIVECSREIEQLKSLSVKLQNEIKEKNLEHQNTIFQLAKLKEKINALENDIDSLVKEKEKLSELYKKMHLESTNHFEEQLDKINSEKHTLVEEKKSLDLEYQQHVKECSEEIERLKSLSAKFQNKMICKNIEHQKELEKWNEKQNELTSKLEQMTQHITNLKSETEHFKCSYNELSIVHEAYIDKSSQEKILLEEDLKNVQLKFSQEKDIMVRENKLKFEEMEMEHQKLQERLDDIDRQLQITIDAKACAEKEYFLCVEQKEEDKRELIAKIQLLQEEIKLKQLAEAEIAKLKAIIECTEVEKTSLKEKYVTELNDLRNELFKLETERNRFSECVKENDKLQKDNCHLEMQIKEIKNNCMKQEETCQIKLESLSQQNNMLEKEQIMLLSKLEKCKTSLLTKEEIIIQKDKQITSLNKDLDVLRNKVLDMEILKENNEKLQAFVDSLRARIENITIEKQSIEDYNKELCNIKECHSAQIAKDSLEIDNLKTELKTFASNLNKLQNKLDLEQTTYRNNELEFQLERKKIEGDKLKLEEKIKTLKQSTKAEKSKFMLKCQNEMRQLQNQVKESTAKDSELQKSLHQENSVLRRKYEVAKENISKLEEEKNKLNKLYSSYSSQIKKYQDNIKETASKLNHANEVIEKKCQIITLLEKEIDETKAEFGSLEQKLRQKDGVLKAFKQQHHSLEVQLQMADRVIREQKKNPLIETSPIPRNKWRHSVSSSSDLKVGCGVRYALATASSMLGHSFPEKSKNKDRQQEGKLKSQTLPPPRRCSFSTSESRQSDYDTDSNKDSDISVGSQLSNMTPLSTSRSVPAGTGDYFFCEDEIDFMNHSHLADLKSGRCELPKDNSRISELQRRNTLCLPHLQSTYPAEMLKHDIKSFVEDSKEGGDSNRNKKMSSSIVPRVKNKPSRSPYRRKRHNSVDLGSEVQKQAKTSFSRPPNKYGVLSVKKTFEMKMLPPVSPERNLNNNNKGSFPTPGNIKRFIQAHFTPKSNKKVEKDKWSGKENVRQKLKL